MLAAVLLAAWTLYPKDNALSTIRVNLLGYAPQANKVAVLCALQPRNFSSFSLVRGDGAIVYRGKAEARGPYGPCVSTYRLDFSRYRGSGTYRLAADGITSPRLRIANDAYRGVPDMLLNFMRDERSGYNPVFHAFVHTHGGIDVESGTDLIAECPDC